MKFLSTRGLRPRDIMSTKLDSLVLLVTISVLVGPTTGHGQLWVKENASSVFNIGRNQEPLLTRRIRQFSGPSTTTIADNNSKPDQNHPPLTCHQCRSFEDGDQCIHLAVNSSIFNEPCGSQHTACMVNKITNFHPDFYPTITHKKDEAKS